MSQISTRSYFFAPPEANKVFSIAAQHKDEQFNRLWIYPAKEVDATKLLAANDGKVWIGERTDSGDVTPDPLNTGDPPILIELPQGQTKLIRDILIQVEELGDGVWFKYWPA